MLVVALVVGTRVHVIVVLLALLCNEVVCLFVRLVVALFVFVLLCLDSCFD